MTRYIEQLKRAREEIEERRGEPPLIVLRWPVHTLDDIPNDRDFIWLVEEGYLPEVCAVAREILADVDDIDVWLREALGDEYERVTAVEHDVILERLQAIKDGTFPEPSDGRKVRLEWPEGDMGVVEKGETNPLHSPIQRLADGTTIVAREVGDRM